MEHTEDYSVPLGPTISRLKMELGAPSLELEARGDSGLNNVAMPVLMTGSLSWDRHEPSKSWEEAGGETRVSIRAPDRTGVDAGKQTWDITLNPSIATSIKVTGGVANVSLDCRSVDLGDLNISAGVVDLDLEFGLSGKETRVMISGGAATVDVTVPRAAGLRVSISSPLTITHDLGAQGMTRSGNAWVTPDYESAHQDRPCRKLAGRKDQGVEDRVALSAFCLLTPLFGNITTIQCKGGRKPHAVASQGLRFLLSPSLLPHFRGDRSPVDPVAVYLSDLQRLTFAPPMNRASQSRRRLSTSTPSFEKGCRKFFVPTVIPFRRILLLSR